jgi:hypothetical protein
VVGCGAAAAATALAAGCSHSQPHLSALPVSSTPSLGLGGKTARLRLPELQTSQSALQGQPARRQHRPLRPCSAACPCAQLATIHFAHAVCHTRFATSESRQRGIHWQTCATAVNNAGQQGGVRCTRGTARKHTVCRTAESEVHATEVGCRKLQRSQNVWECIHAKKYIGLASSPGRI